VVALPGISYRDRYNVEVEKQKTRLERRIATFMILS
jgi:hypothetical protein